MITREVKERNREIALMLGFKYIKTKDSYTIDKVKDDDFVFHDTFQEYSTCVYDKKLHKYICYIHTNNLMFNSNWNWLMEAVEFIENIRDEQGYGNMINIWVNGCNVCENNAGYKIIDNIFAPTKKEAVFIAISDFAKLYNEKKL